MNKIKQMGGGGEEGNDNRDALVIYIYIYH